MAATRKDSNPGSGDLLGLKDLMMVKTTTVVGLSTPLARTPRSERIARVSTIEFACPSCGHRIRADRRRLGCQGRCPACRILTVVPDPEPEIELVEEAQEPTVCPGCRKTYGSDVLICTRCGIHLLTGERLDAEAGSGEVEAPPEEEPIPWQAFPRAAFPGLWIGRTLAGSLVLLGGSLFLMGACFFFLVLGVLFVAVAAGAVGIILYAQSIAWLMSGELTTLTNVLADFNETQWTVFFVSCALPFLLFVSMIFLVSGGA